MLPARKGHCTIMKKKFDNGIKRPQPLIKHSFVLKKEFVIKKGEIIPNITVEIGGIVPAPPSKWARIIRPYPPSLLWCGGL
jgi:hypothetical protein